MQMKSKSKKPENMAHDLYSCEITKVAFQPVCPKSVGVIAVPVIAVVGYLVRKHFDFCVIFFRRPVVVSCFIATFAAKS